RVAIAATGDELVPPGAPVAPGQLPESNGAMLAALLNGADVELIDLGILPDHLDALREAFAAVTADVLITSGGASVGDHDLVRPAIAAAGGTIDFWRVAMRPGKPMMAGRLRDTMVLGLPGNPVSAFVTALLFARPLIAALAGASDPLPRAREAVLGEALPANDARQDYLRARHEHGRVFASTIQDSSMLVTLARADCLIVRAPRAPAATAGDVIEILPIA
nr:molybdopterin molybdotransferase MoeA [Pseudomonadota bacterium]